MVGIVKISSINQPFDDGEMICVANDTDSLIANFINKVYDDEEDDAKEDIDYLLRNSYLEDDDARFFMVAW